jgi:hypothetical protein
MIYEYVVRSTVASAGAALGILKRPQARNCPTSSIKVRIFRLPFAHLPLEGAANWFKIRQNINLT